MKLIITELEPEVVECLEDLKDSVDYTLQFGGDGFIRTSTGKIVGDWEVCNA
jgi:hypothetical protein